MYICVLFAGRLRAKYARHFVVLLVSFLPSQLNQQTAHLAEHCELSEIEA